MQGAARTGPERTESYARTGKRFAPLCGAVNATFISLGEASAAATPQMAGHGQARYGQRIRAVPHVTPPPNAASSTHSPDRMRPSLIV